MPLLNGAGLMLATDDLTVLLNGADMTPCCEHHQHATHPRWHADGDEHYVKVRRECGHGNTDQIFVVCLKWLMSTDPIKCPSCQALYPVLDGVLDLGPVADFHG